MSEELWRFETATLAVICEALPEDMDPADCFEFDEDIAAVRNGAVDWFCARVRVVHKPTGAELGADYLGGCAYGPARDFVTGHRDADPLNRNSSIMRAAYGADVSVGHYFPGMVAEVCQQARISLRSMQALAVRAPTV